MRMFMRSVGMFMAMVMVMMAVIIVLVIVLKQLVMDVVVGLFKIFNAHFCFGKLVSR